MTYQQFTNDLLNKDYLRVERDDRLLDIFPDQIREKGIELWEKWEEKEVEILRLQLPFSGKRMKLYSLPRAQLEELLLTNKTISLEEFKCA